MTTYQAREVRRAVNAIQFLTLGNLLPIMFAYVSLPLRLALFIIVPCVLMAILGYGVASQLESRVIPETPAAPPAPPAPAKVSTYIDKYPFNSTTHCCDVYAANGEVHHCYCPNYPKRGKL